MNSNLDFLLAAFLGTYVPIGACMSGIIFGIYDGEGLKVKLCWSFLITTMAWFLLVMVLPYVN